MIWWKIKVISGLTLIFYTMFETYDDRFRAVLKIPYGYALALVCCGAFIHLFHYYLLKQKNSHLQKPDQLVTAGGLFSFIRHPMYFGDLIFYFGFFLIMGDIPSAFLFGLGIVAIMKQSKIEDQQLQDTFAKDYVLWQQRTKRLIPFCL